MRTALTSLALILSLAAGAAQAQAPILDRTTGPRARVGADLGIGGGTTGLDPAVALGTHVRLGVQLDDRFAVYYQAAGLTGSNARFCFLNCSDISAYSGYFLQTNSVMIEGTFDDLLQVAIGPSIAWGTTNHLVGGLGGSGRLAFTFGGDGIGVRRGFSIGAQVDAIYVPDASTVPTQVVLTLGWETF